MKEIDNKLTQKFDEYPSFGVLKGVKVFVTGTNIAGPFAGCLMAEMGAKVLQAEAPTIACQTRGTLAWSQNHRNEYSITINSASPAGKKIFLKCVEWADIWIEAGRPGSYAKRGLTDEVCWKHNKKLAIVHVSGYGQFGPAKNKPSYDVSGQEIRDFLRTRGNMPTKAALFMGEERFPAGSVAYAATLWIIQDELLALSHTAFTGSNNIEDFSERFTKETPYCLNVLPGDGVTPVGLRFEKTIKKKTGKEKIKTRRGTKTRTVELPQNGLVNVYHTKSGTIFCQRSKPDPVVKARWDLRYLNGTRTLTVDFPTLIDSLSIGLMTANRGKLMPAFAEELTPTSRKTRVIPTAVWLKNERIRDSQYRFNKTAATAVKAAIEASRPRRKAWEAANESDVTRRARALQAKKAASGKARRTPAKKR